MSEPEEGRRQVQEARELEEANRLMSELDAQHQRQKRRRLQQGDAAAKNKAARDLMDGLPGTEVSLRVPLKLLTCQQKVAWQRIGEDGQMRYMIGIGCTRPFSPFSD
ncbi:unnamed protein product [Polarella glacialis]|uniref:Uncharacterized protein n=1 Tax=Polarella glacialis TaxID=89957 RepID=A0A813IFT4_POLGL|nr:unnamed protein product [Polarella glacialis]